MGLVTIVPPESVNGSPSKTQGTKVLLEDGSELEGVTKITLTADVNSLWRADIQVMPKMGVMKGMEGSISFGKPSWWRRALCRLAGVELQITSLPSTAHEWRKP